MLCKATTVLFSPVVCHKNSRPDLRTQPAFDLDLPSLQPHLLATRPWRHSFSSKISEGRLPRVEMAVLSAITASCHPLSHARTRGLSGSRQPSGSSVDNPHRHLNGLLRPT